MTCSSIGSEAGVKNKKPRMKLPNALKTNQYYLRYQRSEQLLFICLLLNIIIAVSYCELDMIDAEFQQWFLWAGYYFHFLCMFVIIVNRKAHYDYRTQYQRPKVKTFVLNLIIRLILLLFRPYPQLQDNQITFKLVAHANLFEQKHQLNHILTLIGLAQSFLLFIHLFNNSKLKNDRSNRICEIYIKKISNTWVIRGWFKGYHLLKLFTIFFAWSIVCTCSFRLVEYRYNPQILYVQNAFCLTFSTMFCIGYGDLVTQTNIGKWIELIAMYTGVIFTYFSITLINNYFKLNSRKNMLILRRKENIKSFHQFVRKKGAQVDSFKVHKESLWRVWRNYRNRQYEVYFGQTIRQIQLRRKMRFLRVQIRKIALKKTVYSEFTKEFQSTVGMITDLKTNHNQILNHIGCSFLNAK